MSTQITLPNLGENIESGDVLSILVSEGDTIAVEQDILEIETDKATMPVPSPQAGKVLKILVSEGDTVSVGAALLEIEAGASAPDVSSEAPPEPKPKQTKKTPPPPQEEAEQPSEENSEEAGNEEENTQEESTQEEHTEEESAKNETAQDETPPPPPEQDVPIVVEPSPTKAEQKPKPSKASPAGDVPGDVPGDGHASAAAGPAARRLARELGVNLRRVRPSGESGRITEDDVRSHVRKGNERAASAAPAGVTPPGTPDSDGYGGVRREKMSRLRQTIARNMLASYTTIPQLTNFDDVDVTELERIRKDSKDDYAEQGVKLTQMPFLIKAIASALQQHPVVNASIDTETNETIYKEYVSIGIAVDTEKGLIVPVLRDADRKSIPQIARELAKIAEMARGGTFGVEDLRGGTFTISNLGAIGGAYSTPIINPPEVAILLAGRSRTLPQFLEGEFKPRLMMPLSLTYDHRIVDGAAAARFLNDVKKYLANPGRLLLAP